MILTTVLRLCDMLHSTRWPAFSSAITFELFRKRQQHETQSSIWQSVLAPFQRSESSTDHCTFSFLLATQTLTTRSVRICRRADAVSKPKYRFAHLRGRGKALPRGTRVLYPCRLPGTHTGADTGRLGCGVHTPAVSEIIHTGGKVLVIGHISWIEHLYTYVIAAENESAYGVGVPLLSAVTYICNVFSGQKRIIVCVFLTTRR